MATGEIIARIILQTLALFEWLAEKWVNVTNVTQATDGNVTWYLNISLQPTGEDFVEVFEDLVHGTLALITRVVGYLA